MSDLIDKEVLYNHFANLEAIALEQVEKHMHDEDLTEWRKWSAILQERTAYKHDVFDAPTVEAEPKHGRWLKTGQSLVFPEKFRNYFCSECRFELDKSIRAKYRYCPNCGAKMDLDEVNNG